MKSDEFEDLKLDELRRVVMKNGILLEYIKNNQIDAFVDTREMEFGVQFILTLSLIGLAKSYEY